MTGIEHGWVTVDSPDASEVNAGNLNDHAVVGDVDFDGNKAINLADPDDPQDAATKQYVDDNAGGTVGSIGARMFVQQANSGWNNTASAGFSFGAAPTNGNYLYIVFITEGNNIVSSLTETNVSWSVLKQSTAGSTPHIEIWQGLASGSAGTGVTISVSGGGNYCFAWGVEFAGLTGTLEDFAITTAVAATAGGDASGVVTPTSSGALVIGALTSSGYGVGFSVINSGQLQQAYPIAASSGLAPVMWGFPGIQECWMRAFNTNLGTSGTRSSVIVAVS
jgi:hypothetical protein